MSADQRLEGLGLTLPPPAQPIGNYRPYRLVGNLLYLSGVGPRHPDGSPITVGNAIHRFAAACLRNSPELQ